MNRSRYSFISEGVGLLVATITAFLCVYYYEVGQCYFYSIPTDYIVFELSMKGKLIFLIFSAFLFLVTMYSYFPLINKVKQRVIRKVLRVLLVGVFLYVLICSVLTSMVFETIILFFSFFSGLILFVVIYKKGKYDALKGLEYWKGEILRIPRSYGVFFSRWLVYASVGCFVFMNLGYFVGSATFRLPVSGDRMALVKRYGNFNFYCRVKDDTLLINKVYVIENPSKDTFNYKWLRKPANQFGF